MYTVHNPQQYICTQLQQSKHFLGLIIIMHIITDNWERSTWDEVHGKMFKLIVMITFWEKPDDKGKKLAKDLKDHAQCSRTNGVWNVDCGMLCDINVSPLIIIIIIENSIEVKWLRRTKWPELLTNCWGICAIIAI